MRSPPLFLLLPLTAACATNASPEPSLAPRAAEAIDPRLPVTVETSSAAADPALAARLAALLAEVRTAERPFAVREAEAGRLAAAAGPTASESWIAAEQALSRLIEQHGVTTRAAADIDALASTRLERDRWIFPADRGAIEAAAAEVDLINGRQSEAIDRLKNQLAR